ncbi:MAG TPA: DNA topoisomerase I, partial [Bacteroidetes bacterium]|nr:DNA topoisomerase I [Bacteroidota bacterium]
YDGEKGLKMSVERQESQIKPADARKIELPIDGLDEVDIFVGRYGPYAQLSQNGETLSTSLPMDMSPGDITIAKLKELIKISEEGPSTLGKDPKSGEDVYLLTGRFGPYVQLGEVTETNKKPPRTSLLRGMKSEDVNLELALKLLSLPRNLGNHPDSGKEIKAGVGRFGPYVVHDGTFKSLGKDDNILEINLSRAVSLLAEAKEKPKKAAELKNLGNHPTKGDPISVMNGRYGPYIKYGKLNVSLPKKEDPEQLTLEKALIYIEEKMSAKK